MTEIKNQFSQIHAVLKNHSRVESQITIGTAPLGFLLLLILILQIRGLFLNYAFYITTGVESIPVYSIWEVQNGMPLYQWPFRDNYQLTLYNFGFYYTYAFVLNLLHAHGPEILLYGRLLTVMFSFVGVVIQTRLIKGILAGPTRGLEEAAIWLISFCTWFNSYFPGYYNLSVRPDVLAVVLCTLATHLFLHFVRGQKLIWLVFAALAWILAWCIKQSAIFSLLGAGFYLLVFRRWSGLSILILLYGLSTGSMLWLGSPEYRWNILNAPRVDPLLPAVGTFSLLWGVSLSLFAWSAVFTLPLLMKIESRRGPNERPRDLIGRMRPGGDLSALAVLACIVIVGGGPAFLALCKRGSSLNHMFEIFVMASSLSYVLFVRLGSLCKEPAARRLGYLAGGLLLSMCIYPFAQLTMHRIGPMQRATRNDIAEKRQFARFLMSLPRPLLVTDEIWNLPWFAGNNNDPLVKLDPIWYPDALNKGLIQEGGLDGLIRRHRYASIYLEKNSTLYQAAIESMYETVQIQDQFTRYKDSLGHDVTNCVLLSAPAHP